jgi:hypothetical protein
MEAQAGQFSPKFNIPPRPEVEEFSQCRTKNIQYFR